MRVETMRCGSCAVEVRGAFRQTHFDGLGPEDAELLERYLLAGFSIKTLEEMTGMGYAAIRGRLDRLIAHYKRLMEDDARKQRILSRLGSGEITVAEARKLLADLKA
jgi:hypothetical protein